MKLTLIDEENIEFFSDAIGDRFEKRKENEIFAGVIDKKGAAVAAAAFTDTPDCLFLDTIEVADDSRRKGIGSFLISGMKTVAAESDIRSIDAVFFAEDDDEGAEILKSFFIHNGFEIAPIAAGRNEYDLKKIMSLPAFYEGSDSTASQIRKISELSEEEKHKVRAIEDEMTDPEEILSKDNIYGGVLFENGKIRAMLSATPFIDGIRIGGLYGDGDGLRLFPRLFEHAREMVRCHGGDKEKLYVDTAGEKTAAYEERIFGRMRVKPLRSTHAIGAHLRIQGV